jgi:hypothetical protein
MGRRFGGNLGCLPCFGKAVISAFKSVENARAEYSDGSNALDVPMALKGTSGINLESHQYHRSFSVSGSLLIFLSRMVVFFQGGGITYSFEHSLNSSLHSPFIVFVIQVME